MLTISRKPGERLILQVAGLQIAVRVDSVNGNQVRLSTEAPSAVRIFREEVLDRMTDDQLRRDAAHP